VGPALSLIHIHIYHFIQTILGGANHFPWGKYLPIPSKQCHGSAPLVNSYLSIINGAVLQQNTIWTTFSCLNTGACVSVASTPRPPEGCERDLSFCLSCGGRKALMLEKRYTNKHKQRIFSGILIERGLIFAVTIPSIIYLNLCRCFRPAT
jgi:hypothetical protein